MADCALVIPLALPQAVERLRRRYDPGGRALPAHLTLAYPFPAPGDADMAGAEQAVRQILRPFGPVRVRFATIGSFQDPDRSVLFLHPEPFALFKGWMHAIWAAFPAYPPFSGRYGTAVEPHVTVARVPASRAGRLLPDLAGRLLPLLPRLEARAEEVWWVCGSLTSSRRLQPGRRFPLRGRAATGPAPAPQEKFPRSLPRAPGPVL